MQIYEPAEDSGFFVDFLKGYLAKVSRETRYLDMGTGSGILAETALGFLDSGKITASDINEKAVERLAGARFTVVYSDLFDRIEDSFDLITFNAPYLPLDSREPEDSRVATTGGKRGDEVALAFLEQVRAHLRPGGKVFLLISSPTPQDRIAKFHPEVIARKKIAHEELMILEFEPN